MKLSALRADSGDGGRAAQCREAASSPASRTIAESALRAKESRLRLSFRISRPFCSFNCDPLSLGSQLIILDFRCKSYINTRAKI